MASNILPRTRPVELLGCWDCSPKLKYIGAYCLLCTALDMLNMGLQSKKGSLHVNDRSCNALRDPAAI